MTPRLPDGRHRGGGGAPRNGKPGGGIVGPGPQESYERGKAEAAVDRGRTRRAGVSRLLVLCAVLFGLFAMHGAPASAAAGCHDATAVTGARDVP